MSSGRRAQSRRPLTFALLALAAAAALGGCTTKNPFAASQPLALAEGETNDALTVSRWAEAYAKSPNDARVAVGYARALKTIGSKDKALEILQMAQRRDPKNGALASELGRLALDTGKLEVAKASLEIAEAQGMRDWRTLSAQGTLHAKQGKHGAAQQYYLAALQEEPDAVSVINNLALSYALDGKADKAASLLKKTVASGKADRRVRQNLALVLGLEGKFDEARQLASVDMEPANAQASVSYLRNMMSAPGQVASLDDGSDAEPLEEDHWQPYAETEAAPAVRPAATARMSRPVTVWTAKATTVEEPAPANEQAQVAANETSSGGSTTVAKTSPAPKRAAPPTLTPPAEPAVFRAPAE